MTYGHSGNNYRVDTLSKLTLTTTGITMQSLKSGRMDGHADGRSDKRADHNYRKFSLLKIIMEIWTLDLHYIIFLFKKAFY